MVVSLQKKLEQLIEIVDILESNNCNVSKHFLNEIDKAFNQNLLHDLVSDLLKEKQYILLQSVLPIISDSDSNECKNGSANGIGSKDPGDRSSLVQSKSSVATLSENGNAAKGSIKQLEILTSDSTFEEPDDSPKSYTSETVQIITLKVFYRCSGITRSQSYFPVRRLLEEQNLISKDEFYEELPSVFRSNANTDTFEISKEEEIKIAFYYNHHKCHKLIDSAIESLLRKKWLSYGSTEKSKNRPICITQEGLDYLKLLGENYNSKLAH